MCKAHFKSTKNAMQMRIRIDRRGSRNTLRLSRLSYVKYSTGANMTICTVYRALRKPDLTVARRAFLDHLCNDNTHNGTICLFARKRYFASCASFLHTFFWQDRKKYARGATVVVAQKSRHCGEYERQLRACGAVGRTESSAPTDAKNSVLQARKEV